jgi:hypothetical protein
VDVLLSEASHTGRCLLSQSRGYLGLLWVSLSSPILSKADDRMFAQPGPRFAKTTALGRPQAEVRGSEILPASSQTILQEVNLSVGDCTAIYWLAGLTSRFADLHYEDRCRDRGCRLLRFLFFLRSSLRNTINLSI